MTPVAFEKADEVVAAYDAGRCDTYTTDKSGLAAQRTKMSQTQVNTSYYQKRFQKSH